jgi:pimeloyl-ACP methyl ester carboxylesterase
MTGAAGLALHVREYGKPRSRRVLVLLHGLFGSSGNWGSVARRLEPRYRLLVPDLRNHGQSPHHPDNAYPAMAADVLRLLDDRDVAAATLVGHSMGGKVAMRLALSEPQRVSGLAVVDMAPVRYGHDFRAVLAGFHAVDLAHISSRADADAQMAPHVPGRAVRAFLLQNLARGPDGWAWRLNLSAIEAAQARITGFDDPAPGARYEGPASFIHGTRSDYVTPSSHARIRALFPQADHCPVEDAGHWVYADQPQRFMDCLERFLARAD